MNPLILAAALCLGLAGCHGRPDQSAAASTAASRNAAFLAANAKAPGVTVLPDGLQYKVIQSGPATGAHPGPADEVKVNYEGKLISGEIFDSSFQRGEPADLPLQGLIPAWIEALQLMRPGDEWMLYVPPQLGYGDAATGPIPPNSVLIFKIQLLGALQHPDGPAQG